MSIARVRQSQLVGLYGPGALVDLPDSAILVGGLDHWRGEPRLVEEPRLIANLRERLRLPALELRAPPVPDREDQVDVGVVAWQFPEWFVAQYETISKAYGRSRPLVHRRGLVRGKYVSDDPTGKKKQLSWPVVPMRFVQSCPNGHVSDIPWPRIVHGEGVACGGQLWIDERGTTGDLSDLFLRCDGCDRPAVPLSRLDVKSEEKSLLGPCRGERPWLGPNATEQCANKEGKPHTNRLLIRHASHAYFPVVERAISIPDHDEELRKRVDAIWDDFLSAAESREDIQRERKKQRVARALEGFSNEDVWAECQRRHLGGEGDRRGLKEVELATFLSAQDELGEDRPQGTFYARRLPLSPERTGPARLLERVVLVHRLREVVAQVGFTRFEPPAPVIDADTDLGARIASLAVDTRWLPATENRGEGIFLALQPEKVRKWLEGAGVKQRASAFYGGIQMFSKSPTPLERVMQRYMPYVLIHSLSHLLLTAITLECGYSAASVRERIYVDDNAYALLLYTGTPDAEGTLGGLVHVGRRLDRFLEMALELGRLCSNDPVCAQHAPDAPHEERRLHGASCHGCLLIAEPSCERRNELLDRALVVPTVDCRDAAFFGESP